MEHRFVGIDVAFRVHGLVHPVGVEEEGFAGPDHGAKQGIVHAFHRADHRPADALEPCHAVVAEPKRGIVPAVGVEQFSGIKIEHADKQCDEHALGVVAGEVFVDLGHEVLRRGVGTRPRSDKGQGHAHEQ